MVHNFLNGEIVNGNHPPIISEETFLKANEALSLKYTGEERKRMGDVIRLSKMPLLRIQCYCIYLN